DRAARPRSRAPRAHGRGRPRAHRARARVRALPGEGGGAGARDGPMKRARLGGALLALALSACTRAPAPRAFSGRIPAFAEHGRFAVVGDLQRTSALEFWRESNDAERALVVGAIAAERPALLAMTGDL